MIIWQMATISYLFDLEKKMAKKSTSELSSDLLPVLQLLESLELRLNEKKG